MRLHMRQIAMSTELSVRAAALEDAAILCAFNAAMALETEAKILDAEVLKRGVEAVLKDPSLGFYRIAERGGVTVGSLMVTFEWSDWRAAQFYWIQSVYVAPVARRSGVYSALYADVQTLALAQGACGIRLYAEVANERAHRTYRARGMQDGHYVVFEESLI